MRRGALWLVLLLVACSDPPIEADRAELIGVWNPDDNSDRRVEFKPDGVFDYLYDPMITLRLDWKLERKGRVTLTSGNGVETTCSYKVTGNTLAIDDGSGKSCIGPSVTPPSPMPVKYTKAP